MGNTIELEVHLARDEGTGRWYIASSDLPGLRLEADTAPDLIREIENVAPDLIELNYDEIIGVRPIGAPAAIRPAFAIRPVIDTALAVA